MATNIRLVAVRSFRGSLTQLLFCVEYSGPSSVPDSLHTGAPAQRPTNTDTSRFRNVLAVRNLQSSLRLALTAYSKLAFSEVDISQTAKLPKRTEIKTGFGKLSELHVFISVRF